MNTLKDRNQEENCSTILNLFYGSLIWPFFRNSRKSSFLGTFRLSLRSRQSTNFGSQGVKRSVKNRTIVFFKDFHQSDWYFWNRGLGYFSCMKYFVHMLLMRSVGEIITQDTKQKEILPIPYRETATGKFMPRQGNGHYIPIYLWFRQKS